MGESLLDPAIPLGRGCQPLGVIQTYDPSKGFGFIRCDNFEEEIFFSRSALPSSFQSNRKGDLPDFAGMEVSFQMTNSSDREPRADEVTLLLKWHSGDRCWLLKRS